MLCDNCKKREATIHIKEVRNGKCISTNLCPECAKEKELAGGLGAFGFNLAEVIFNSGKKNAEDKKQPSVSTEGQGREKTKVICPACGWNTEKMRTSGGKMGCPECYSVFEKWVKMAVDQVQRGEVHIGKRPGDRSRSVSGIKLELDKLQLELAKAVSAEEYEKAALFRDRINLLKKELGAKQRKGSKK